MDNRHCPRICVDGESGSLIKILVLRVAPLTDIVTRSLDPLFIGRYGCCFPSIARFSNVCVDRVMKLAFTSGSFDR